MQEEVLVKVEQVSKKFCKDLKTSLKYGVRDIMREVIGLPCKENLRNEEFWAVNDVSFELKRGDCLGLIGHNGAGKSTLLKMLNGLIKPDKGRITMKGRIGALIELGAGFNPILTGRENIYVNGQILGFSKKEIDRKLDAIIDFAEIDQFINTPVQNYSSGMKVRLGFAVAAQMEPDVLIIDEVLAVGDVGFRIKCFNAITDIMKNSAVIFVSHAMQQIARISSQVLLMENGKEYYSGKDIFEGIQKYYQFFSNEKMNIIGDGIKLQTIYINAPAEIGNGSEQAIVNEYNNVLKVRFEVINPDVKKLKLECVFFDKSLVPIATTISPVFDNFGMNEFKCLIKELPLASGSYTVNVNIFDCSNKLPHVLCKIQNGIAFQVQNTAEINHVSVILKTQWETKKIICDEEIS